MKLIITFSLTIIFFTTSLLFADDKKLFDERSKGCYAGNIDDCYDLGFMYYDGTGVKQDYSKSFQTL